MFLHNQLFRNSLSSGYLLSSWNKSFILAIIISGVTVVSCDRRWQFPIVSSKMGTSSAVFSILFSILTYIWRFYYKAQRGFTQAKIGFCSTIESVTANPSLIGKTDAKAPLKNQGLQDESIDPIAAGSIACTGACCVPHTWNELLFAQI
ncbi:hypothetical protein POM88_042744 [Heracleum sosnowskyi]|uniref:Uncharacterized protein n=1 Tax=Heracleum sosnowskyi TaxID=360622 RepID=A0AAD8HIY9_9APIA|nr:hypothetical protein POM88_042744 [Heracleum sosnowskyi]